MGRMGQGSTTLLLGVVLAVLALPAYAAPARDLWARWQAHAADSQRTIDHSTWTTFLQEYRHVGARGVARIDYGAVDAADRQRLEDYIDRLSALPIDDYSRPVQFAYWVNLYNATTIDLVLKHYPVASIRDIDISPGWFSDGPWDAKLLEIEGQKVSLNDIEHRILRPIWHDPRIHYSVNCASVSCPNLQPVAFSVANTEHLLDRGARQYVNSPRGFHVNGDGQLIVSSIYEWYQADFGGSEQGVLAHLRRYANAQHKAQLAGRHEYAGDSYDWRLNDVEQNSGSE